MESSLYIHIPFCRKKCDYCDFFSVPCRSVGDGYINAVRAEIMDSASRFGITSWGTVYVGGGTPSLLSPMQLSRLFEGIRAAAPISSGCEVTVEMNPEGVRGDFVAACSESGVNRISLGIQSLDDGALRSVHRGCMGETAIGALSLLESCWGGSLSVDFIAGLPSQGTDEFGRQFGILRDFKKINHVSLYTLTVEDETPLGRLVSSGGVDFSQDDADSLWMLGRDVLESEGFFQYEVSNFARRGCESRHNSVYWHSGAYVGCGAGASGTWYFPGRGERWTNRADIDSYVRYWLGGGGEVPRDMEILDMRTMQFEFLMMGFRLREGISAAEFSRRFQSGLSSYQSSDGRLFGDVFAGWKERALAGERDGRLFLARDGILLLNRFLEELL